MRDQQEGVGSVLRLPDQQTLSYSWTFFPPQSMAKINGGEKYPYIEPSSDFSDSEKGKVSVLELLL